MPEETTLYEANGVKVTNLRAVFGQKTYAVSNITAVETQTQQPSQAIPVILAVIGAILLIVFLASLFGGNSYNASLNRGVNWASLILGALMLSMGVGFLRAAKPAYIVGITTSSGEVKAWSSADKAVIEQVVEALNDAIVQKG